MRIKLTRTRAVLFSAALLATIAAADEKTSEPKFDARLAPLARFPGEWTVDAKWSDGSELHGRSVYEWGLGGKILKARTFVKDGDKEYQRYESTMAWHPR